MVVNYYVVNTETGFSLTERDGDSNRISHQLAITLNTHKDCFATTIPITPQMCKNLRCAGYLLLLGTPRMPTQYVVQDCLHPINLNLPRPGEAIKRARLTTCTIFRSFVPHVPTEATMWQVHSTSDSIPTRHKSLIGQVERPQCPPSLIMIIKCFSSS
jgi:hypothetical protein